MQIGAFWRVLIDRELECSGWNLVNPKEMRFVKTQREIL